MVSKYCSVFMLLAIIGLSSALRSGFMDCPIETNAVKEVAKMEKEVPASLIPPTVTLKVRVPESGLLGVPITCIVVTDSSPDGEDGTGSIIDGGVGSEYVEIKIVSNMFRGLHYRIQVWTE